MWQVTTVIREDRVKICSNNPSPISSQRIGRLERWRGDSPGGGGRHFCTLYLLRGHPLDLSSLRTGTVSFLCVYLTCLARDLIQGRSFELKQTLSRWKITFPHRETIHLLLGEALTIKHKPLLRLSEWPRGISLLLLSIRALCKVGRFSSSLGMPL